MDQGLATDLSLEVDMYESSPSAEYESWFLMEPIEEEEEAPAPALTATAAAAPAPALNAAATASALAGGV